jgi:hypothetical protein
MTVHIICERTLSLPKSAASVSRSRRIYSDIFLAPLGGSFDLGVAGDKQRARNIENIVGELVCLTVILSVLYCTVNVPTHHTVQY